MSAPSPTDFPRMHCQVARTRRTECFYRTARGEPAPLSRTIPASPATSYRSVGALYQLLYPRLGPRPLYGDGLEVRRSLKVVGRGPGNMENKVAGKGQAGRGNGQ